MDLVIYFMKMAAITLLDILELAFLLRAIFSWIPMDENVFTELLYRLTEPLILPVRKLLYKINFLQDFPLDISFLLTSMLLLIARFGLAATL